MPEPTPEAIKRATEQILSQDIYRSEPRGRYAFDFGWLDEKLAGFFSALDHMAEAVSPAVAWLVTAALVLVLFALLGHIAYTFYMAIRRTDDSPIAAPQAPRADPGQLAAEAEELCAQGHYADASRKLYLAALTLLENHRDGRILKGLTNSEYLDTFRSAWVVDNLSVFARLIDGKWYRDRAFSPDDYSRCRVAFRALHVGLRDNSWATTPEG